MNAPRSLAAPRDPVPWVAGLAALFWALDLLLLRSGTPHPLDDVWEYAVAARALLEGDAFRTPMVHPPLWGMRDAMGTVPILIHGPLLPVLFVPLVVGFGGAAPAASSALAAGFAVTAAALTCRLGERALGRAAGVTAAALVTLSPLTIRSVHHDPALVVGAALLAGTLALLSGSTPRAFTAGAALGAAYLARPEMLLAAPLVALAAGRGAPRFLGGFALIAAPWWTHLAIATGQPFFNLSSYMMIGYGWRPELSPLRDFGLTPARWPEALATVAPTFPGKWAAMFPHVMKRALTAPTGTLGWLAALGFVAATVDHGRRRMAGLAIGLAAIPVVVQTLTVFDSRYLVPFLPLFSIAAAWAARRFAARVTFLARPRAWAAVLVVLALPPAAAALREGATEAPGLRARLRADRAALAPLAATRAARAAAGPLFSDAPDYTAWLTGRTVLWLHETEYRKLPAPGDPNPDGLPLRSAEGLLALADSSLTGAGPRR